MARASSAHAVVIGASMAGLVAARAAARHFDQVTVLERQPEPEPGTSIAAQGRMAHAMLQSGSDGLETMFPGIKDELIGAGAIPFTPQDWRWWWRAPASTFPSPQRNLMASRGLFETVVRRRVGQLGQVDLRYGRGAAGLLAEDGRVSGVRLAGTTQGDAAGSLDADLVIDCSGKAGLSDRWLAEVGLPGPTSTKVGVNLRYAQVTIPAADADEAGPRGFAVQPVARLEPRSGMALRIEGNRWHVILASRHGEAPPTDPDGFRAFARSLPAPYIADLLDRAPDIGDVTSYRFPASQRRDYVDGVQAPAGLASLGDSVASFNPLFGQGMAVAIKEALLLDALLRRHDDDAALAAGAADGFARVVDEPWGLVTGVDLSFPQATGDRPRTPDFLDAYVDAAIRASLVDPKLRHLAERYQNLQSPVSEFLRPGNAMRVLRSRKRWQARTAGPYAERVPAPDRPSRVPTVLVGGAPIRLDDQGTGNPTLFLHGNPESAESWAGVVERLAPAMRCLVPDLPGFGRSAVPETFEASPAGVGAFTAALLDAAGVGEPVDVVAHDFGGAFGLSLAIDHPERVRRLVLVSTPAYVQDFPLHPDARRWRTPVVGEVSLALMNEPGMRYALRKANPRITDEQVRAMYRRITPVTKQMILRLYRGFSPEEWGSWERRMLARTASLPTMVIQGDDPYIPDWVADRFGARRVAHLRGYGHFLPLEAPEQLAQEIASFLAAGEDAAAPTAAATS